MKKTIACIVALALPAFILLFPGTEDLLLSKIISVQNRAEKHIVQPIPTALAKPYLNAQNFRFPGKVKAARRAELSFQIAGQIEQLNILEGQQVKKGYLLASLEHKNHLYAVRAARAGYQASKLNFQRTSKLYKENVVSKAQFDTAQSVHDIARAELDMKEKALTDTRLITPFDGLVSKRYAERKEHVNKGEPVLLLQDVSGIEVEVQLPEQLVALGGTEILDQLNVCFDANPDLTFAAEAMELRMESSNDTRTYALIIKLPSPADMHILPGMTATVSGIVKQSAKTKAKNFSVLIPVEAVVFDPNADPYVWIVDPQTQKARKQQVVIGPMHGNSIEVTKGIRSDELVATAGLHSLDEEQRVRPMKAGKKGLEG
ncbi:efflux RND transporter periplasmic adaptor subunit [Desulfobacula toluolica]|uniref:Efflux transporter, RND family, MFP subunit n=1 Tax=Desulfobacula toluolica (strain DSM 7467 / Tol2) TaxID=651182 RepID=K0NJP7_DESTT|nr:efflux RND transporter periplasmic adaptor subunit [Desulfobacula toluolica]CCK79082.1 efflux transporter, RND family, MFP subunit precursor [Desulfobacula toluolica Tol2]